MKKLLITIAILSCASLCGCANSGESAVSSESASSASTTAQSTTATSATTTPATTAATTPVTTSATTAQSTSVTTSAAVTTTPATSATTTAATTTTTTAETTASEAVEEIPEAAPELPTDPIADQIAQEREDSIPIATDEQVAQIEQDRKDRQDLADDTSAYTTDGIPLTTNGDLTEPAKPTANYKLPDGAQLEFTGDPDTAETTVLPDGCYWTPTPAYPNAFTDPAGNRWCNRDPESIPYADRNQDNGYYSPDGEYHFSQYEIDAAAERQARMDEIVTNGPTGKIADDLTEEEGKQLAEDILNLWGL